MLAGLFPRHWTSRPPHLILHPLPTPYLLLLLPCLLVKLPEPSSPPTLQIHHILIASPIARVVHRVLCPIQTLNRRERDSMLRQILCRTTLLLGMVFVWGGVCSDMSFGA